MNRLIPTLFALCAWWISGCDDGGGTSPADGADADADVHADADSPAEADTDADAGADADSPAEADAEAGADADADATCERTTTLSFSLLRGDMWWSEIIVDEAHDMLLGFPQYMSAATDHLVGVSLTPGAEEVVSLPVTGDVPAMNVVAATYDPGPGRSVLLGYPMRHPGDGGLDDHMELATVTLDAAGAAATLTRVEPTVDAPSEGVMFSWIYPEGDGTHYRAFRFGGGSDRATVTGTTVAWEPTVEITIGGPGGFDQNHVAYDPTSGRLFGYGEFTIVGTPPDFTVYMDPIVYELSIAGGTVWNRREGLGTGPARQESPFMIISATVIYDDGGRRLLVLQDHPHPDPWGGTMNVTGAWTFSDAGMWTVINEDLGRCCATASWSGVDDRERRRSLLVQGSSLGGIDLRPGHEGESVLVDAGIVAHDVLAATFDTSRGQILATAETGLASMAVRDAGYAWVDADGAPTWPSSTPPGHSIVYDAGGDRVVLFGGTDPATMGQTDVVRTLDRASAVPAWVTAATSGPTPGARTWHSAIADAATRTMYVVGGYRIEAGSTVVDLADVAALDLASMTWRSVAALPVARSSPLLRLGNGGAELFVIFGEAHPTPGDPYATTNLRDAYRINTATGAVETLAVSGELPTVSTRALGGLDMTSGYVVLSPESSGVEAFTGTLAGSTLAFVRGGVCEDPHGFGYGPGVVDPATGVGYSVGDSVWEVRE